MDERPKKRRGPLLWLAAWTWREWLVLAAVTPVLYIVSFALTCHFAAVPERVLRLEGRVPENQWMRVYQPIGWIAQQNSTLADHIYSFVRYFMPRKSVIMLPTGGPIVGGVMIWNL